MNTETGRWLRYWRNSLADAELGKGALRQADLGKTIPVYRDSFSRGHFSDPSAILAALFRDEPHDTPVIKVLFRPAVYLRRKAHGKQRRDFLPDVVTPVACLAWVGRDGRCWPAGAAVVPRDLLAPQAEGGLVLGQVDAQDDYLTLHATRCYSEEEAPGLMVEGDDIHRKAWGDYVALTRNLFREVCAVDDLNEYYLSRNQGCLTKVEDTQGSTRHILKLYDWLVARPVKVPLLSSYAHAVSHHNQPCVDPRDWVVQRCAHPNSKFPLAAAQRAALAQTLALEDGGVLAINGPPGTGKTTFVLAVVASMWVDAAVQETEPPLIIAASTNNQAVTNVIEAFGKDFEENDDPLSGRWLPDVNSYGGYFPAVSKEQSVARQYQTPAFYRSLEQPEYLKQAEGIFVGRARMALNDDSLRSVEQVRQRLHGLLSDQHRQLVELDVAWARFQDALHRSQALIGDDPSEVIAAGKTALARVESCKARAVQDLNGWRRFCAGESIWLILLSVFPPVARKRRLVRTLFVEDTFATETREFLAQSTDLSVEQSLTGWLEELGQTISEHTARLAMWVSVDAERRTAERQWQKTVLELSLPAKGAAGKTMSLEDIDPALDTSIRFRQFQLAVHYWEARWLEDCRDNDLELARQSSEQEKTGLKSVRPRWKRRMKLTPCIVSTLHSLPGHMTYSVFEGEGKFREQYLVNEIDLLIVDEAGQVAPEIAGASFSLAKRAVVIGDVHQIEPVRSQTRVVDVGNLLHQQLLSDAGGYKALCATGRSVVDGSVMRIAQLASGCQYLEQAEPGMYLREHRRCFDDVISFCNALCYEGLLEAKRGAAPEGMPLPSLGYLHIDGYAESPVSGSRINRLEAVTVADWLVEHRTLLEGFYGEPLENLVGVVTPFKAQAVLIRQACQDQGINVGEFEGELTVGTVHALQGAERRVVLFSSVYSRHGDGDFIDSRASMLNVAVSRAKDSFLVFGDMEVLASAARGTPRQLLADRLFSREGSELSFRTGTRPDLLEFCREPKVITNAEAHDELMVALLEGASKTVDMVSPWISLDRLRETGILARVEAAVVRGVDVSIYTDYRFNTFSSNRFDSTKGARFKECCAALRQLGVQVFVVEQVHSKLVMVDERFMCVGSFNWASAARDGIYKNLETSVLYSGYLTTEIQGQLDALQARVKSSFNQEREVPFAS